jgi:hypothetical protein
VTVETVDSRDEKAVKVGDRRSRFPKGGPDSFIVLSSAQQMLEAPESRCAY